MKRKELKQFLKDACGVLEESRVTGNDMTIGDGSHGFKLTISLTKKEVLAFTCALTCVGAALDNEINDPTIFAQAMATTYIMMCGGGELPMDDC